MPRRSRNVRQLLKPRVLPGLLVVVAVLTLLAFHLISNKKTVATIPSTNPASNSRAGSSNSSEAQNTAPSSPKSTAIPGSGSSGSESPATDSTATLKAPYGTFVSNHSPGQNSSGSTESSTCITTPGATCYIQLTKGNETKLLQATATDNTGTAYWNWDVSNPKLSAGDWTVTAVATLNGETKSAQDSRALTIQ